MKVNLTYLMGLYVGFKGHKSILKPIDIYTLKQSKSKNNVHLNKLVNTAGFTFHAENGQWKSFLPNSILTYGADPL